MRPFIGVSPLALTGWLQLAERELLLFALAWFILGMIDEIAIDGIWMALRLSGRVRTARLAAGGGASAATAPLIGPAAVLIAAWHEAEVIGATVRHILSVWQQRDYRLYVGCYVNDVETIAAVMQASGNDPRLRIVIHARAGPTSKADCLNRLYAALGDDEARTGLRYRMVLLQDAEDMVHPAGLALLDAALDRADFVQLPVRPEIPAGSHWIAGHYADEFTESHAKAMVVRDALGAAVPAAGVGCAFSRPILQRIARRRLQQGGAGEGLGPFAPECFTEDYELGMLIARMGATGHFLRQRDAQGQLVATRSFFPATLHTAVRQKTRWIHGIAFQGWDRLGWQGGFVESWMALRDRKGPLAAVVLTVAYLMAVIETVLMVAHWFGAPATPEVSPALQLMLRISFVGLGWRAGMRFLFTTREYGPAEGLRGVLRIPVANVIAIMAARRALGAYIVSLLGGEVAWEKTAHHQHPADMARALVPSRAKS